MPLDEMNILDKQEEDDSSMFTAPIVIQPFVKANVITGDRLCVREAILVAGENNV